MKYRKSRIKLSPGVEKLIVVFFLALLFLGVVALISSFDNVTLSWLQPDEDPNQFGDISNASPDEDDGSDQSGTFPEGTDTPVAEFGGTTVFFEDFENPDVEATKGSHTMNGNTYNLIYDTSYVSASYDGALSFTYSYDDENPGKELHANFYPRINGNPIAYDDVSYISYDFDINAEKFYDQFYLRAIYDNMPSGRGNDVSVTPTEQGAFVFVPSSAVALISSSLELHFTLIYRHDAADHANTLCQVYVNGVYFGSSDLITKSATLAITSFRIGVSSSNNLNATGRLTIDNISINVFDAGYEGAISKLFDDTSIRLQDCSDSVLYSRE